MEMGGNGWKLVKMGENGWKWVKKGGNGWKWVKMGVPGEAAEGGNGRRPLSYNVSCDSGATTGNG